MWLDIIVTISLCLGASLLSVVACWGWMRESVLIRYWMWTLAGSASLAGLYLGISMMEERLSLLECVRMGHGTHAQCYMERLGEPLRRWDTRS
jgi:hypothetical protein